jgi:NAD(P)-dependent dehydrogenase (short-subunit alcohol dehydrogenase family)
VNISGSTVVVTGAASGIGFAIADACAAEGARVVLADVEQAALDDALARIRAREVEAIGVCTDVRRIDDLEQLRNEVERVFGGTDILCNNAGVLAPASPTWNTPMADLEWTLDVNLWGIVRGIQIFVPAMLARGTRCHVVNTASMAAFGATPENAAYGMSKAAVVSLSCSLRDELRGVDAPVGVSVLLPEMVRTRLASAERNRGERLGSDAQEPVVDVFESGLPPAVLGDRVVGAVKEERFWVLPPANDVFAMAATAWMQDIQDSWS